MGEGFGFVPVEVDEPESPVDGEGDWVVFGAMVVVSEASVDTPVLNPVLRVIGVGDVWLVGDWVVGLPENGGKLVSRKTSSPASTKRAMMTP